MNAAPPKLPPHQAALDNLDDAWFARFEKIGLKIVLLRLDCRLGTKAAAIPNLEQTLGAELFNAGIGAFDSTFYLGTMDEKLAGIRWHFFHAHDLGKVVAHLKSRLAELGLLPDCTIFHCEKPRRRVVWYSPNPELIGFASDEKDIPL